MYLFSIRRTIVISLVFRFSFYREPKFKEIKTLGIPGYFHDVNIENFLVSISYSKVILHRALRGIRKGLSQNFLMRKLSTVQSRHVGDRVTLLDVCRQQLILLKIGNHIQMKRFSALVRHTNVKISIGEREDL